jgi:hypothetical protein
MVSDDEILSAAHRALAKVNAGSASLYAAGEDFMREVLDLARGRNMLSEREPTPPGVIGN